MDISNHVQYMDCLFLNPNHLMKEHPLFRYLKKPSYVYFVHSYSAVCGEEYVIADTEYGARLTAAVAKDNVMGCQFHPEKSGDVGLAILKAFAEEDSLC